MARHVLPAAVLIAALAGAGAGAAQAPPAKAPLTIRDQKDGVNALHVVTVAAFCRSLGPCAGTATLTQRGKAIGRASYSAQASTTFKTPIRLSAAVFRALHKAPGRRMRPTLTMAQSGAAPVSHVITIHL